MSDFRVTLITVPNREEAQRIAKGLVEERLAACVNIIPAVESIYWWQGEVCNDDELLLIVKTEASKWEKLCSWVTGHHSYEVPEIIQIPVVEGSSSYLHWLELSLSQDKKS